MTVRIFLLAFLAIHSLGARSADLTEFLSHDGQVRQFLVHVPPRYRAQRATPLVIALHGGGGSAQGMDPQSGWSAESDEEGFLVVYPPGTGKRFLGQTRGTWNAGNCCGPAVKNNVDDVGFISRVIDRMEALYNIDTRRVFVTGISNGAMMSYRLACELSERIRAIGPVAGVGVFGSCPLRRAVPTIHIHGIQDPCEPFNGGESQQCYTKFLNTLLGIHLPREGGIPLEAVPAFLQYWSAMSDFSSEISTTTDSQGTRQVFGSPLPGRYHVLYALNKDGHVWPGGTYGPICLKNPDGKPCRAYRQTVGPESSFPATKTIWKFFENVSNHH